MTTSLLVEHFDDLLDIPEDLEQLNRTILQLAVQGKLVSQDSHDEPAIDALKRILRQKEQKILPTIDEDAKVFELPKSWVWINLGFLSENIHYGYTASADFGSKGYKLLRITDIQNSRVDWESVPGCEIKEDDAKKYLLKNGDILIARTGGTIGKSYLIANIKVKAVFASYLIRVLLSKEIMPEYLKVFLDSPLYWRQLVEKSKGTGQPNVNATSLSQLVFGLPPLTEQQRIVARVEELFAQTRELAEQLAHSQRELDLLNKSALAHLIASETPEEFNKNWAFIVEHFDLLFQTPEHVTPLRQSILELAVRGKLTRSEAGDVSGKELLKRIHNDEMKLGKNEFVLNVKEEEKLFDLPQEWEWARLRDLGQIQTGTTPPTGNLDFFGKDFPFIKPGDITETAINYTNEGLSNLGVEKGRLIKANSILMVCIGGSIGKVGYADRDCSCNQQINAITPSNEFVHKIIYYFLKSPYFQNEVLSKAPQTTLPILSKGKWEMIPLPIPPLAEQDRIVKRVEELLGLCDALESRLRSAEEERRKLVAAVMAGVGD